MDALYIAPAWTAVTEVERGTHPWADDLFRLQVGIKELGESRFLG